MCVGSVYRVCVCAVCVRINLCTAICGVVKCVSVVLVLFLRIGRLSLYNPLLSEMCAYVLMGRVCLV